MGTTSTVEHLFITQDIDKTFNMIEDEHGEMFWGYGHRDSADLGEEINRWLIHACGVTDPDDLIPVNYPVSHLWAQMDDEDGERFSVSKERTAGAFPVTRLNCRA